MTKFKRELVPGTYLTAADMLSVLSQQKLTAAALEGQIVLAAEPPVAWLLDRCCIGRAAMQGTDVLHHTSSSGSSRITELLAAAHAAAGANTAGTVLWEQYRQHQQQLLAQQQRKASRGGRRAGPLGVTVAPVAPSAAAQPEPSGGSDGVQLLSFVHLSFQEAVFLSHVLGSCQVYKRAGTSLLARDTADAEQGSSSSPPHTQQGQQQQQQWAGNGPCPEGLTAAALSDSELWQWCCEHTTGGASVFAPQYAAYHHLRCLGWLPLPGLAYGADYVLYQLHPEMAHSDFVVTIMVEAGSGALAVQQRPGHEAIQSSTDHAQKPSQHQQAAEAAGVDTGRQDLRSSSTQLAWLDACIMHRLARQVLKEMLLLYVVVPARASLQQFECIHDMQVREVLVQRWVPAEHREA